MKKKVNDTMGRYAVYATARDGSPRRLDWVGLADNEDDAIRQCYAELSPGEDVEASTHVVIEVADPTITADKVISNGDQREVTITMVVGAETFTGTAILMQRHDGVWADWGDSVGMWLDSDLIKAADLAEQLDEGTRHIVLSEVVATARGAIRRA